VAHTVSRLTSTSGVCLLLLLAAADPAPRAAAQAAAAQGAEAGQQSYVSRCSRCHGTDGNGGETGPAITARIPLRTDAEFAALFRDGLPAAGMPALPAITTAEAGPLVAYLRRLRPRSGAAPERVDVTLAGGRTLSGLVMNRSLSDLQLLGDDRRLHLLRREGNGYRAVTSQSDWPTYNGGYAGPRHSTLSQITIANVARLAPRWTFTLPNTPRLQGTPLVVEGVMYVTSGNEIYALDAGSGRQIWHYQRPRTKGQIGNAGGGVNRGAAVAGDRVFMATDNAHLIALDRMTGRLLWESEMADWRQNYGATGAPLTYGRLVVSGVSGGDEGVRGFLAAFDQATGKEVWRFWTVPKAGEPGSETWSGASADHPGGATWLTGTYDPELDTLYWPVGNPGPDFIGDGRAGDNLYTSSIVALDATRGTRKWHFQYTPHDVWDFDAQQTPALVDATWRGEPRKLLIQAHRNGFFYVLDRTNGRFLSGTPFVDNLTWATGLTPEGRPIVAPNQAATPDGNRICPHVNGATNWYSTSFNPATGLYYVQTNEWCSILTRTPGEWEAGKGYFGGSFRVAVNQPPAARVLRAIDIQTGRVAWQLRQAGGRNSWGGTLSTAGGLVFFGEDSGAFMAVDAADGRPLWQFQTSQFWNASPMTYLFDQRQFVAVASGSSILAFGLVE
jgi:alcohol dehydrogenase (cytochrome c)